MLDDKNLENLTVIRILDTILESAILENAEIVHFEPNDDNLTVRYRVDGLLKKALSLPKSIQPPLTGHIKALSGLKIDECNFPQEGRFKISSNNSKVICQTSIIPVFGGEKIVLKLVSESKNFMPLENLGLEKNDLDLLKINLDKPSGLVLVTGPATSGKTTTLYSMASYLNRPEVNIAAIEERIECHIPQISQSQVNRQTGFTYANGLRFILRQDPDIILLGEINNKETAELAIHAAAASRLVLSTIPGNNAAGAWQYLINLGIPRHLALLKLNLIMAQRLARKICQECIESYKLEKETLERLDEKFKLKQILKSQNSLPEKTLFYKGKGCKNCNQTGYKGRVAIFELAEGFAFSDDPRNEKINRLFEDGLIKAIQGLTSLEEILRVVER